MRLSLFPVSTTFTTKARYVNLRNNAATRVPFPEFARLPGDTNHVWEMSGGTVNAADSTGLAIGL
jgi:hypothetical protein